MGWYPLSFLPTQIDNSSGQLYSGAVLKAYAAGTNNPIPMATDYTGQTTMATSTLNASGYPTYNGTIIIPHLQQNYKMALYPDAASAAADSGAIWTIDNNQIAPATNQSFVQYFDGDGVNGTFTLSQDFGTDENVLMVFADRAIQAYTANSDFASDTIWTKGAGWTIGGGVASAAGALNTAIQQNAALPIIQGQSYTVEFTVTASAGTLTPSIGGNNGTTRGAGTWRETIIAGPSQVIAFTGVGFTGTLDNASVKATNAQQRTINRPDEITIVGNQLTLQNIPPQGTKNVIVFAPSLLLGAANNAAAAAATSEANALNYRNQAQQYAAALNGTSTTSNTVAPGLKSFTTQPNKNFAVGSFLTAASAANVSTFMFGQVQSYNATTGALVISVGSSANNMGNQGSTASDWILQVAGIAGPAGAIGSGTADMKSQNFTNIAGLTQLQLTNTPLPASAAAVHVFFDTDYQHDTEWSINIATGLITLNSPVPNYYKNGRVIWFKDIAVATPTDGSTTPRKMSDMLLLQNGQCRLDYSAGNVVLSRKNGKYLIVNGVPCQIPAAGVSLSGAAAAVAANTLYYIYARDTNADDVVDTLAASTTGYVIDNTTGLPVKNGDPTQALVGMAWASALNTWGPGAADCASYYNRKSVTLTAGLTTAQTASTTVAEIANTRVNYLTWDNVDMRFTGSASNAAAGTYTTSYLTVDGVTYFAGQSFQQPTTFIPTPVGLSDNTQLAEGRHFTSLHGQASSGTSTWYGSSSFGNNGRMVVTVQI